jgi:hypothetical protein
MAYTPTVTYGCDGCNVTKIGAPVFRLVKTESGYRMTRLCPMCNVVEVAGPDRRLYARRKGAA